MTNGKQKKSADGRPTHYSPSSSLLPSTIKPCKWKYLKIGTTEEICASSFNICCNPQTIFVHHVCSLRTNCASIQSSCNYSQSFKDLLEDSAMNHFPCNLLPWFFLQIIFRLEKLSAPELLLRFDVKGKFRTIYHPLEAGNDLEKKSDVDWCLEWNFQKHHLIYAK